MSLNVLHGLQIVDSCLVWFLLEFLIYKFKFTMYIFDVHFYHSEASTAQRRL